MSSIYNRKIEVEFQKEDGFILDGQSKICNWFYNRLLEACINDYKENGNLAFTRFPSMQLTGLEPVRAQCSLDP